MSQPCPNRGSVRARRAVVGAALVTLAGCGRIGYEALDAAHAPAADAAVDAADGPSTAPCRSVDRYRSPVALTDLNTAADETMLRLDANGMAYFGRDSGSGAVRVFRAKVSGKRFTEVAALDAINGADAGEPTVAADGSLLLFSGIRGGQSYDIYGSVSLAGSFTTPAPITALNSATLPDVSPYLLASGKALYFVRVEMGRVQLYRATVDGSGTGIGEPQRAATIPAVTSPVVSEDELELFYGDQGDVFRSTRTAVTEPFAPGVRITTLSSSDDDAPSWLSKDGCAIVISSRRLGGGGGGYDLWGFERP